MLFTTLLGVLLSLSASDQGKGHLVLMGGGPKPAQAMKKFIELAGGTSASIVILPTASEAEDTPEYYTELFAGYGCHKVIVLPVKTSDDAANPAYMKPIEAAGGIFFTGGDQRRITKALLDTPMLDLIKKRFRSGVVVGGTSAGTACMSPLMLTGDGKFDRIVADNVVTTPGLGLASGVVLDQHFLARQRQNRLLSVVLTHPQYVGVGVDEDTAAWFSPDGRLTVLGNSQVLIYDARHTATEKRAATLVGSEMRLHLLAAGDYFSIQSGQVVPVTKKKEF